MAMKLCQPIPDSTLCPQKAHTKSTNAMGFLLLIARSFINTFGITQPGPEGERRAAYFIGVLLALIVLGMIVALAGFLKLRG